MRCNDCGKEQNPTTLNTVVSTERLKQLELIEKLYQHEIEVLHKASVSMDAAITKVFGRPWSHAAQITYAAVVSAAHALLYNAEKEWKRNVSGPRSKTDEA